MVASITNCSSSAASTTARFEMVEDYKVRLATCVMLIRKLKVLWFRIAFTFGAECTAASSMVFLVPTVSIAMGY